MGKKSRAKRERRQLTDSRPEAARAATRQQHRQLPVFWIAVGVLVVGMAAAIVWANQSREQVSGFVEKAPEYAKVDVDGDVLSLAPESGGREGTGEQLPTLTGTGLDATPMRIPEGGGATIVVVLAHWCPHCQAEVPRIVDWFTGGNAPAGVNVLAVSTAADKGRPNYPPAKWLEEESWNFRTLVDDELGTAGQALGLQSFPLIIFADASGEVQYTYSGEMPVEELTKQAQRIAPPPPKEGEDGASMGMG